jgi:hypothetical protein
MYPFQTRSICTRRFSCGSLLYCTQFSNTLLLAFTIYCKTTTSRLWSLNELAFVTLEFGVFYVVIPQTLRTLLGFQFHLGYPILRTILSSRVIPQLKPYSLTQNISRDLCFSRKLREILSVSTALVIYGLLGSFRLPGKF